MRGRESRLICLTRGAVMLEARRHYRAAMLAKMVRASQADFGDNIMLLLSLDARRKAALRYRLLIYSPEKRLSKSSV